MLGWGVIGLTLWHSHTVLGSARPSLQCQELPRGTATAPSFSSGNPVCSARGAAPGPHTFIPPSPGLPNPPTPQPNACSQQHTEPYAQNVADTQQHSAPTKPPAPVPTPLPAPQEAAAAVKCRDFNASRPEPSCMLSTAGAADGRIKTPRGSEPRGRPGVRRHRRAPHLGVRH